MNKFLVNYLSNIIPVTFNLKTKDNITTIGKGKPQFTFIVHNNLSEKELLKSTSLALGEAYMRGDIDVDKDLYEVLNLFLGEMDNRFISDESKLKKILFPSLSQKKQREEVSSHYDLGNDFFKLWLDETMSYSCGYFKTSKDTLYGAQMHKVDHTLEKLQMHEGMRLLDIGCGWGALLIHAAKKYGVKGLGITLSKEQYAQFSQKIIEEHLENQLEVKLMDYRELENSGLVFDLIVSIGMLEHVGRGNYDLFLKNIDAVLKPQGLFLLHYISQQTESKGDAWMRKYIFPGGVIPSFREIISLLPNYNFDTLDVENLRRHYRETLLCWSKNFKKVREEVVKTKGEEFARMWELYLAACAACFNTGALDLHQILVSKGVNNSLPMIRTV